MKTLGRLYGIGVGPGDPELMTVKGARILSECRMIFVPISREERDSAALTIAAPFLNPDSRITELKFPMTTNRQALSEHWDEAAQKLADVLLEGHDCCFLTLGDPLLYSTYIYLLRHLRKKIPDLTALTIPGVNAFSAAAALTEFPVGEAKAPVTIIPTADDLAMVEQALERGGTVILMKIGKRLTKILDILDRHGLMDKAVFVARAGQKGQRIETDLRRLKAEDPEAGYLSILLVHAEGKRES
jgi:precorrin-2/cobalt-factor-2 C20-methyltransferase